MPKGYLIAQVTIHDPVAYGRYVEAAGEVLKSYGARVIVDPQTALVKEGRSRDKTIIFEFDNIERAKAFWASPEYSAAKALRVGAAEGDYIIIEAA